MSGALLASMRNEAQYNVMSGGFETDITITDKNGKSEIIKGLAVLHNSLFNAEAGGLVNGRNARINLSVDALTAAGFELYSDTKKPNAINIQGWRASFVFNGKTWLFSCDDVRPSETFGIITIQLGDAK